MVQTYRSNHARPHPWRGPWLLSRAGYTPPHEGQCPDLAPFPRRLFVARQRAPKVDISREGATAARYGRNGLPMPISPVLWHAGLRQCAPGRRGATCSAPLASWWRPALAGVLSAASAPSWRHLAVIAFVFGPGCGTDNCGRKSTLSRCSSKPLLSGFVRRAIDRHSQYQNIFFIARDLDGDELAQEGAERPGILRSDRTEALSATEDAESPHDRLANVQHTRRLQRSVNAKLYRQRNLIERCFNKTQALPAHPDMLRETCPELSRRRLTRLETSMDPA